MPVTVTVSRGNPMPWPIALVLTVVGLGLMVAGFTVIPGIEEPGGDGGFSSTLMVIIAAIFVIPTWVIAILVVLKKLVRGKPDYAASVPEELPEPPRKDGADVVGVVIGAGDPPRRAVAGTLFQLADREAIDIEEYGEQVVVTVAGRAAGGNASEQVVVAGLQELATDGKVEGTPDIWPDRVGWWREYVRDARKRALAEGLLQTRFPLVGAMLVFIFTAVGFSLVFFWRIPVFVGSILFANGIPHLLAGASGYKLSPLGETANAQWGAFARFLRKQGSFRDVGPAAVAVWGPNLAYGAVLGVAKKAARPLTPGVDDEDIRDDAALTQTQVYEL